MEVRVENLCKAYGGKTVLDHLSFTVERGVTCVMAPSGSGKTTLLRLLLGLETPDSGRVIVPEGLRWAAVFQEDRLLEHLDALGNLRFVLGAALEESQARQMLKELGLGDAGGKPVRAYSGGMKRRLALCRALLAPSDALALDEPFTGLDGENRSRAMESIRRRSAGKIVILVTHEAASAAALEAKILRL
ncbi:ATP-binding cassette domain-containing protein [Oscillibacter sp.]|uniref:ATP-binding cassette domain-containing protein n=1 Tax=Oscillibacter sp. TaxID=1945593 RepID=UPI00261566DD|nr:ATP-binding cassette domain-containing protein [Oscillibacter sp.]MDD3347003.1 ATP-binding cassette domain-containing protein [Oscillibacter sp.]